MAPENLYPAALNDSDTVFDGMESNHEALGVDPERTSIGGDSAGGNLSAAISIRRRAQSKNLPQSTIFNISICRSSLFP